MVLPLECTTAEVPDSPGDTKKTCLLPGGEDAEITLTGTPATTYWIEYTSDLTATNWPNHHVVSTPPGSNSATVTLPEDAVGDVFFRSRIAP